MWTWFKTALDSLIKSQRNPRKRRRSESTDQSLEELNQGNDIIPTRHQPRKRHRLDTDWGPQQDFQNQFQGEMSINRQLLDRGARDSTTQAIISGRRRVKENQGRDVLDDSKVEAGNMQGGSSTLVGRKNTDEMLGNQNKNTFRTPKLESDQLADDQFLNIFRVNPNVFPKTEEMIKQFKLGQPLPKATINNGIQKKTLKTTINNAMQKKTPKKLFLGNSFRKELQRYNQLKQKQRDIELQEKELQFNKLQVQKEIGEYQKFFQEQTDVQLLRPSRKNLKFFQNLNQRQQQVVCPTLKSNQTNVVMDTGNKQVDSLGKNQEAPLGSVQKILSFDEGLDGFSNGSNSKTPELQLQINISEKYKNLQSVIPGDKINSESKQQQQKQLDGDRVQKQSEQIQNLRKQIDSFSENQGYHQDEEWLQLKRKYQQARSQREKAVQQCGAGVMLQTNLQLQQLRLGKEDNGMQERDDLFLQNGLGSSSKQPDMPEVRIASQEMENMYSDLTDSTSGNQDDNVRFHQFSNIQLKRKSFRTLGPNGWLDDEIINTFMGIFQERSKQQQQDQQEISEHNKHLRCHFFNSFFLNQLFQVSGSYNYSNVQRWTLPKKLKKHGYQCVLDMDRIIVPVHLGNHWTCAMIDLHQKRIEYYDSLNGKDRGVLDNLRTWVKDEFQNKKKQSIDEFEVVQCQQIPQQNNGYDCGVFAVMFMDYLSQGKSFDFGQKDMDFFRKKMVFELMTKIQTVQDPAGSQD